MRCPKCSFISFDHLNFCAKCGRDLSEITSQLHGTSIEVEPPIFLGPGLEAHAGAETFETEDDAVTEDTEWTFEEEVARLDSDDSAEAGTFSLEVASDDEAEIDLEDVFEDDIAEDLSDAEIALEGEDQTAEDLNWAEIASEGEDEVDIQLEPDEPVDQAESAVQAESIESPDLAEFAKLAEPPEQAEPTEPVDQAESIESIEIAELAKLAELTEPTEQAEPTELDESAEPTEPVDQTESIESIELTELAKLAGLAEPAEPTGPAGEAADQEEAVIQVEEQEAVTADNSSASEIAEEKPDEGETSAEQVALKLESIDLSDLAPSADIDTQEEETLDSPGDPIDAWSSSSSEEDEDAMLDRVSDEIFDVLTTDSEETPGKDTDPDQIGRDLSEYDTEEPTEELDDLTADLTPDKDGT